MVSGLCTDLYLGVLEPTLENIQMLKRYADEKGIDVADKSGRPLPLLRICERIAMHPDVIDWICHEPAAMPLILKIAQDMGIPRDAWGNQAELCRLISSLWPGGRYHPGIGALPPEIRSLIYRHLKPSELSALSMTSRQMHKIVSEEALEGMRQKRILEVCSDWWMCASSLYLAIADEDLESVKKICQSGIIDINVPYPFMPLLPHYYWLILEDSVLPSTLHHWRLYSKPDSPSFPWFMHLGPYRDAQSLIVYPIVHAFLVSVHDATSALFDTVLNECGARIFPSSEAIVNYAIRRTYNLNTGMHIAAKLLSTVPVRSSFMHFDDNPLTVARSVAMLLPQHMAASYISIFLDPTHRKGYDPRDRAFAPRPPFPFPEWIAKRIVENSRGFAGGPPLIFAGDVYVSVEQQRGVSREAASNFYSVFRALCEKAGAYHHSELELASELAAHPKLEGSVAREVAQAAMDLYRSALESL